MPKVFLVSVFLLLCLCLNSISGESFSVSADLLSSENKELTLKVSFKIAKNHYLYADKINIKATDIGIDISPTVIPEPEQKYDKFTEALISVYKHDTTFIYSVKSNDDTPINIQVNYQGCSDIICYFPASKNFSFTGVFKKNKQTPDIDVKKTTLQNIVKQDNNWRDQIDDFIVIGRVDGYVKLKEFAEFLNNPNAYSAGKQNNFGAVLEEKGIWILVLIVMFGGLALNLTPCMLPMIPINIAIIGAGAQADSRTRGFILGGVYGLGITLVYGILGLVVVFTGTKFGTLNASPWFNFCIALIFLLMALSMFGVFSVDLSKFQSKVGIDKTKQGTYITSFLLGGVMALLAGACVAPVVISVLLFSADLYKHGNVSGLLMPFLLGAGMALPWPFAGAGLSFLPKPGKWMNWVKYGFGLFILLFALWYAYIGTSILSDRIKADRGEKVTDNFKKLTEEDWIYSFEDALNLSKKENKPLFIDFWASWCKNCLKMEKTTFDNPEVKKHLKSYIKLKYKADDFNDPEVKATMDYFGIIGLPAYVLLSPKKLPKH